MMAEDEEHMRYNQNPKTPTATAKKPRGRPRGSKNKPKPMPMPMPPTVLPDITTTTTTMPLAADVIISGEAMRPMVLEICAGSDVVDAVSTFAKRRNMGICVLGGSGTVSNLTLRHPQVSAAVTVPGRFHILSLSGSVLLSPHLYSGGDDDENVAKNGNGGVGLGLSGLSISVAGGQGQVIGGVVAGKLTAASAVVVVAAAVVNPSFHRLGGGEEGVSRGKIVNSESCRGNNDSASSNGGGGVVKCDVGGTSSSDHLHRHDQQYIVATPISAVPWAPRMN